MTNGLPLPLKLLVDIAGPTLTLVLAWMSIQERNPLPWFRAALMVATGWALLQAIHSWLMAREQKVLDKKTDALIAYLAANIQHAATIEYRIRDDANREEQFETYRDEIEGWRTRVGDELEQRLPRTGASQMFLAVPGEVGVGRLGWERSQLLKCQAALISILGVADAFVRRLRTRRHPTSSGPVSGGYCPGPLPEARASDSGEPGNDTAQAVRDIYKAALDYLAAESENTWTRFNAMLVVHTILIAVSANLLFSETRVPGAVLGFVLFAGLVVCFPWWSAIERGVKYQDRYVEFAKRVEKKFPYDLRFLTDGAKTEMTLASRLRTLYTQRIVIFVFFVLYLSALGYVAYSICQNVRVFL